MSLKTHLCMSAATEEDEKIFVYLCNIERQISIDKRTHEHFV